MTITTDHPGVTIDEATRLPELDSLLLFDLIRWAEMDENDMVEGKFITWGKWDQGSWSWTDTADLDETERREALNGACRTSYCIAGQTVWQGGYRMVYHDPETYSEGVSADLCIQQVRTPATDSKGYHIWVDDPGAEEESIPSVAQRVLGLTEVEADALFEGSNEVCQLQQMANTFMAGRGLPPLFPNTHLWPVDRSEGWGYWTNDDEETDDSDNDY